MEEAAALTELLVTLLIGSYVPLWKCVAGLSHPRYVGGDLIRGRVGNEDQLE